MLFCIAGFSILYFNFYDYLTGSAIDTINFAVSLFCAKLINSIYFSLISFTTIGYGDILPIGMLRFVTGLEGLFGILLTASFMTVLARRYT